MSNRQRTPQFEKQLCQIAATLGEPESEALRVTDD